MIDQIAAAPISWGVCEVPDWGLQLPPERVLAEMSDLGFTQTEAGAAGYLPEAPEALAAKLAEFDLSLLGGFVPLVLHKAEEREASLASVHETAAMFRDAGATYFVTSAVTTWDWAPREELTEAEWQHLYEMLDLIEDLVADYGLVQAVHPHIQTVIEQADEVQRVLDNTRAGWTYDTGHLLIGGYDPIEFGRNYTDRIRHVHLKDVELALSDPVMAGEQSIMEGVQAGMFCNLGAGDVAIDQAVQIMVDSGFDGWYVIEQDAAIEGDMPPVGAGPARDVAASVEFLRSLATGTAPTITKDIREITTNEGNS